MADESAARNHHGHPTPRRLVNEAIGVWPRALWLPFSIYRSPSSGRQSDPSFRGSRGLLLDQSGMGRPGPAWPRVSGHPVDIDRPRRPRSHLDRGALASANAGLRLVRQAGRALGSLLACGPVRPRVDLCHGRLRHAVLALSRVLRLPRHESGDGSVLCRASRRAGIEPAHRHCRERTNSRAAVSVQQSPCGSSLARRPALVLASQILSPEPRDANRTQWRTGV
jgi:hypothetical protein